MANVGSTPFDQSIDNRDLSEGESKDFLQDIDEAKKEGLSVIEYTKSVNSCRGGNHPVVDHAPEKAAAQGTVTTRLSNIESLADLSAQVSVDSPSISHPDYGLMLDFDPSSLSASNGSWPTPVIADIRVYADETTIQSCIYPEESKPVSAVYSISLSDSSVPVRTLRIRHCADPYNPEELEQLAFAKTTDDKPRTFELISGGIFKPGDHYGEMITLEDMGLWTIVERAKKSYVRPIMRGLDHGELLRAKWKSSHKPILYSRRPRNWVTHIYELLHHNDKDTEVAPPSRLSCPTTNANEDNQLQEEKPYASANKNIVFERPPRYIGTVLYQAIKNRSNHWLMQLIVAKNDPKRIIALREYISNNCGSDVQPDDEFYFMFQKSVVGNSPPKMKLVPTGTCLSFKNVLRCENGWEIRVDSYEVSQDTADLFKTSIDVPGKCKLKINTHQIIPDTFDDTPVFLLTGIDCDRKDIQISPPISDDSNVFKTVSSFTNLKPEIRSSFGPTPTLDAVFGLLKPHSAKWNQIGEQLRVSLNFREELHYMLRQSDSKLELILNEWIESECSPVTWDNVMNAMEKMGFQVILNMIKEQLGVADESLHDSDSDDEPGSHTKPPPCPTSNEEHLELHTPIQPSPTPNDRTFRPATEKEPIRAADTT